MRTLFWVKFSIPNPRDWCIQTDTHSEVWDVLSHYIVIQKSTKLTPVQCRYTGFAYAYDSYTCISKR